MTVKHCVGADLTVGKTAGASFDRSYAWDISKSVDKTKYEHFVIDHAEKYADGQVHTNGLENFWSLLKRAIRGTYVSVEPFHLFRYLDEQCYRFNRRKLDDAGRFFLALFGVCDRRLTYKTLTGSELPQTC